MRLLASVMALTLCAPAAAQSLAIVNAEAWTLDAATPIRDATILIDDGRIVSVTKKGDVPPGADVIDARGKPVTPGLVNGATQIGLTDLDLSDDRSADERDAGYDPSRALNGNSTLVSLARADGLTRALVYPSPSRAGPISGEPVAVRLREGADILDRSQVAAYAVIGGGAWDRLGARAQQWTVLRRMLADAKRATPVPSARHPRASGGDAPPPGKAPVDGILSKVVTGDIPLAIETHRESDIRQAAALALDYDIHLIIVGASDAWRAADALAAAKISVILDPLTNLPADFDELGARQDAAAILAKAGVRFAFGLTGGRRIPATYNAGMSLREGAGIAVANGLPYIDALRAVTVEPLAIWGRGGGTLTSGADADLVLWDGDPLEPSSSAVAVIIEGRRVSHRSRQDMLAERYKDGG